MTPPDFTRNFCKLPIPVIELLAAQPVAFTVYGLLCSRAAWQPGPRNIGGRTVHLQIGECVAGRRELAEITATSEQSIRTALNHLQATKLVTIEATKLGSVVTICGYAESARQPAADQPRVSTNDPTTIPDPEDPREELSPPGARAIPGTTDPAPEHAPEPEPQLWTDGTADLVDRATALGVDVADELGALDDRPDFHPGLETLQRQRLWLRRAIDHAKKHPKPPPSADRGEPRKGPRSARHEPPCRQAQQARTARQEAEDERQRLRDNAASTPSAEERSRMLRELMAGIAPDLDLDAAQGAA